MINYIVQVVLFQVLFLVVYDLFLNRETFFKWNRLYLIATPILSFIIPLLKFETFKNTVPQEYIVMLPEVVINPQVIMEQSSNSTETTNYLMLIFISGVVLFSVLFLAKLIKLINTIVYNKVIKEDSYMLVLLAEKQSAFSFFNYIFINQNLKGQKGKEIIQHELVHCKHLHSLDLLFFEFFKIVMWFNPLTYIYQKRITLLHEYISDAEVVKETDKKSYFNKLLSETFNVEDISFVNQFYKHSLIKKRIAMITKKQSNKLKQLKYLVLVPLLGSMLLYSSCEKNESTVESSTAPEAIKAPRAMYTSRKGEIHKIVGETETYLDLYVAFNDSKVQLEGEKIEYGNLLPEEKIEYDEILDRYSEMSEKFKTEISLFQIKGGRRVIVNQHTMPKFKTPDREEFRGKLDVPFALIDMPPVFPGCEGSKEELKSCLNKNLQKHVATKFNTDLASMLGLQPGKKKIYIQFKILNDGNIEIVGARAPHPDLETEGRRVVNSLPKMKPGIMFGKPVNVTYMLPITFNVAGNEDSSKENTKEKEAPTSVTAEKRK